MGGDVRQLSSALHRRHRHIAFVEVDLDWRRGDHRGARAGIPDGILDCYPGTASARHFYLLLILRAVLDQLCDPKLLASVPAAGHEWCPEHDIGRHRNSFLAPSDRFCSPRFSVELRSDLRMVSVRRHTDLSGA